MRKSAPWMVLWDDRLLELAYQRDHISATEAKESGYLHVSRAQISRRLNKLAEHGLLRKVPNGVFVITDEGEAYLEGELNAAELSAEPGESEEPADV